jgi:hypothetical protein
MLKERRLAAEQIATALWDAETAIDVALTKTADFTGKIPALRRQAGASALIGQEAMERASQAVVALAEARRALVEAHKELTIAKQQVGLGAVVMEDTGGGPKPPIHIDRETAASMANERNLRSVAAA